MALTPEMEKYLAKCERGLGIGLEGVLAAEVRRLDAALESAEAALRKERERAERWAAAAEAFRFRADHAKACRTRSTGSSDSCNCPLMVAMFNLDEQIRRDAAEQETP